MAVLKHVSDGALQAVPARLLVGRGPAAALQLASRRVSGEHATLAWSPDGWKLRDLGSTNGTFVEGRRLESGETAPVARGAHVAFGDRDDPWELVDDGPPQAMASDEASGALVAASGGMLALPDGDAPALTVYRDARGHWVAEMADGETWRVASGVTVRAGTQSWRLLLPELFEGTTGVASGLRLDAVALKFGVSRDEEHVEVTIVHGARELRLEAREHGYVLLTMARSRLQDAALPPSEQGWLDRDELLRMLRIDANGLNVAVHRARQQFADAGVEGAAGLVEVRRGKRRIGVGRLEIGPL